MEAYAERGWSKFASGTRLLIRRAYTGEPSDDVTPEEDSTSLKKAKVSNMEGTRYPFKRDTVDLAPGATEESGGVFIQ